MSSHATGEDHPRPVTATLHLTLSLADHVVGSLPSKTPEPAGPRNCGQAAGGSSSKTTDDAVKTRKQRAVIDGRMFFNVAQSAGVVCRL